MIRRAGLRDITPGMENQAEGKMDDEMDTGVKWVLIGK